MFYTFGLQRELSSSRAGVASGLRKQTPANATARYARPRTGKFALQAESATKKVRFQRGIAPLTALKSVVSLEQRYFYSVRAFAALRFFVLNFVFLAQRLGIYEVRDVNEDVFASFVVFDETKAFGLIEEFYRSGRHKKKKFGVSSKPGERWGPKM